MKSIEKRPPQNGENFFRPLSATLDVKEIASFWKQDFWHLGGQSQVHWLALLALRQICYKILANTHIHTYTQLPILIIDMHCFLQFIYAFYFYSLDFQFLNYKNSAQFSHISPHDGS